MTFGIGNLVALISIVISIIFAIVTHQAANALWWALLLFSQFCGGTPVRRGVDLRTPRTELDSRTVKNCADTFSRRGNA
jgi:hypothetical protein